MIVWTSALVLMLAVITFFMMVDAPATVKLAKFKTQEASGKGMRKPASFEAAIVTSKPNAAPSESIDVEVPCELPARVDVPNSVFQVRLIGAAHCQKSTGTIQNLSNGYTATLFDFEALDGSKSFSTDYVALTDLENRLRLTRQLLGASPKKQEKQEKQNVEEFVIFRAPRAAHR